MTTKRKDKDDFPGKIRPVYVLPGGSGVRIYEHLHRNFFYYVQFHNNYPVINFFIEYLYPDYADIMINFEMEMKDNHDFYKDKKYLSDLMDEVLKITLGNFNAAFVKLKIPAPALKEDKRYEAVLVKYVQEESPRLYDNWKANNDYYEENAFYLQGGTGRNMMLAAMVLVIDEVFLYGKECNKIHNRAMFEENTFMSFGDYLMIRMKCRDYDSERIGINPMEAVWLLSMLDMTAQILTGDIADTIARVMEDETLNQHNIEMYLGEVENFTRQCRIMFETTGTEFGPSLVPYVDWCKVLK